MHKIGEGPNYSEGMNTDIDKVSYSKVEGRKWLNMGQKTKIASKASLIGSGVLLSLIIPPSIPFTAPVILITAKSLKNDLFKFKSSKKAETAAKELFYESRAFDRTNSYLPLGIKNLKPANHQFEMFTPSLGSAKVELEDELLKNLIKIPPRLFGKPATFDDEVRASHGNEKVSFHKARLFITFIFDKCQSDSAVTHLVVQALAKRANVTDFTITNDPFNVLSIRSDEGLEHFTIEQLMEDEIFLPTSSLNEISPLLTPQATFYANMREPGKSTHRDIFSEE